MKNKFPKDQIKEINGSCISLRGDDVDTDRIIPARFLKCVDFHSLGGEVFKDDRISARGSHPFDLEDYKNASILVVNDNFGCGSSREHAPQALMRWGIRGVIGQSFAEIFYGNCLALGIPCATVKEETLKKLQEHIEKYPQEIWSLNLEQLTISNNNKSIPLKIEKGPLEMFLTGRWDATSQLISQHVHVEKIVNKLPYLNNFISSN